MNSMTGYGTGRAESLLGSVVVEVRSVNNRFLDVTPRLPQEFSPLESTVRAELQKRLQRGKVYLNVRFDPVPGATEHYQINAPLLEMLESFCATRGHKPSVESLLGIDGVVIARQDGAVAEQLQSLFEKALGASIDALEKERAREGETLRAALLDIQKGMADCLAVIERARGSVTEKFRDKLRERIDELLGPKGAALDAGRLEQEVALFAEKADITEEVTRLRAHLEHLAGLLAPGNPNAKGRALDFLTQEMIREINTIGSKARDLDITRQVLDLKGLAEQLKEQIANVE